MGTGLGAAPTAPRGAFRSFNHHDEPGRVPEVRREHTEAFQVQEGVGPVPQELATGFAAASERSGASCFHGVDGSTQPEL
ncbi:hypothetical protein [Paeniglutamicibacter sp.]|uniref:hypothetical protein n=1 Tax=Paeniglutamicibacter sp. TaxID=1934391 RepID=UPI003988BB9D